MQLGYVRRIFQLFTNKAGITSLKESQSEANLSQTNTLMCNHGEKMCELATLKGSSTGETFTEVKNPLFLKATLEERLPYAAILLNQLTVYEAFKDDLDAYIFYDIELDHCPSNQWIVFCFKRKDWGKVVTISPPSCVTNGFTEMSLSAKQALEFSPFVDWKQSFVLLNLPHTVSDFLIPLSLRKCHNLVKLFPCYFFYLDMKDAFKSSIQSMPEATVGPLQLEKAIEFFRQNWSYFERDSEDFIRKSLPHSVSAAVYLENGEIACAAFVAPYGHICTLVTNTNHRRNGYGTVVMQYLFREMARNGLHPIWETSITNLCEWEFHMRLKPQFIRMVDNVCHKVL